MGTTCRFLGCFSLLIAGFLGLALAWSLIASLYVMYGESREASSLGGSVSFGDSLAGDRHREFQKSRRQRPPQRQQD